MLDAKGSPQMVERTLIRPPSSQLGPLDTAMRAQIMAASPMAAKYDTALDRESAFELLKKKADAAASAAAQADADAATQKQQEFNAGRRYDGGTAQSGSSKTGAGFGGTLANIVVKELKGTTGRRIVRGILGSLFKAR
jgi:hypothetical protein